LVQTQPVSPERPQVADVARFALVASRIAAPYLRARREINEACWSDSARWKFGFYFGRADTRLCVPRRMCDGSADDANRVINFGHPMGRRPFKILMTAYAIGLVGLAMTGAAVVGLRW
jgi:uncharacterized membrane protein